MPDRLMIAAFAAQLRLSGYTRIEERRSSGICRVCYRNPERPDASREFQGSGGSIHEAERSAIHAYLEWARTGRPTEEEE
jgi:hypothetical protein